MSNFPFSHIYKFGAKDLGFGEKRKIFQIGSDNNIKEEILFLPKKLEGITEIKDIVKTLLYIRNLIADKTVLEYQCDRSGIERAFAQFENPDTLYKKYKIGPTEGNVLEAIQKILAHKEDILNFVDTQEKGIIQNIQSTNNLLTAFEVYLKNPRLITVSILGTFLDRIKNDDNIGLFIQLLYKFQPTYSHQKFLEEYTSEDAIKIKQKIISTIEDIGENRIYEFIRQQEQSTQQTTKQMIQTMIKNCARESSLGNSIIV